MANITKIYDIKLRGQKELIRDMELVNKSFDEAKNRFVSLKSQLASGGFRSFELGTIKTEMEQARLEMLKLKKQTLELTNEGKSYTNALRIQREEERKANDERKVSFTEYRKLSRELTELRNHFKEVAVIFGTESQEFRRAAAEANKLDAQLKNIDASLGQFQRNVGNYPKTITIGEISKNTFDQLKNSGLGDILGNQVDQVRKKVQTLEGEFLRLKNRIKQTRESGGGDLKMLEKQIIQNRIQADKFNHEIRQSSTHLNGLSGVGSGVFGKLKTNIKQLVLESVGLQAAMSAVSTTLKNMHELSDQTTNLEIELGKAAGGADYLVSRLAQIDTRTKLVELENIANIALKAGVSEGNLVGVTGAIDKIKIAFGKDFGDVEQGTESLVKLINIFEGEGNVTEMNLLQMGNAIRTLANETESSVPFLNDFSKRMAGLKGISDISLPSVLGLASGFEQFGQTAEVSSTALVKIIPKLANDTEKFAKVAGVTQQQFKELLNSHPEEALIKVSEGLVKGKHDIEGISKAFSDSELGSGRIASVLGVIGKNGDSFRKSITSAGEAYKNTSNITDAFNKKNQNLAGTLDKIGKKFSDLGSNKTLINLITLTSSAILGLIQVILGIPFSLWIGSMALLTVAYWDNILATLTLIGTKSKAIIQEAISNGLKRYDIFLTNAQRAATFLLNGAKRALFFTMGLFPGVTAAIRFAWLLLNTTFLATPLGWILAGILAIGTLSIAASKAIDNHSKSIRENAKAYRDKMAEQRVNAELDKRANEDTSATIAKMNLLSKIAKDNTNSLASREKALKELIAINPDYLKGLTLENINTAKGTQLLDSYKNKILEVARAKAAQNLLQEKTQKLIESEYKIASLQNEADKENPKKNKIKALMQSVGRSVGIGKGTAAEQQMDMRNENKVLQEELDVLAKMVAGNMSKKEDTTEDKPEDGSKDKIKSKLSTEQKDYLKELEAKRDRALAINEELYTKGEKNERDYLQTIKDLNVSFYSSKISYLKGINSEELREQARASLSKAKIEKETNDKLFELDKQAAEKSLRQAKNDAQEKLNVITDNPRATAVEKDQAEQIYYQTVIEAQTRFNSEMDKLERDYNQNAKDHAEKRSKELIKSQSDLNKTLYKLILDRFKQTNDAINKGADEYKNHKNVETELKKQEILRDKSLSAKAKEIQLSKIIALNEIQISKAEVARVEALIRNYELKKGANALNEEEKNQLDGLILKYAELNTTLIKKENDLPSVGDQQLASSSGSNSQDVIKENIINSFELENSEVGNLLGNVIAGSFDLANSAMNSYFDGERQRIEESKQLSYQRLDLEKNQLLAHAQSSKERETIEKQFAEKKKQTDKEAGEKLKKVKKTELQIALAMELANIAIAAASNPLNGVTFGAAGIAMYSVLAGLALAKYAMNVGSVNKSQFARGGKLTGPSHSQNNGMPVVNPQTGETQAYLEGGEAIVNKKSMNDSSQYSVIGTPAQIISKINAIGGGVDFAGGASLKKYLNGGTYLGSNVQPPIFRSYLDSRNNQSTQLENSNPERLSRIEEIIEKTNVTLNTEVNRKTVVSSKEITHMQKENNKQSKIPML